MMKCKIITFLFMIAAVSSFRSQNIIFTDKNLEKAVIENYDFNKDGFISLFEAEHIENLFVAKKNITSTEDLDYFKNLKIIFLDENSIPNISIKNLGKLNLFSCANCKTSTFYAENLKSLTSLYLDNNTISSFSAKSTPRIDQLTLSLNNLTTIDVSGMKFLRRLNLEYNQIKKLDISKNIHLESINITKNPLLETDIKKSNKDVIIFGFEKN